MIFEVAAPRGSVLTKPRMNEGAQSHGYASFLIGFCRVNRAGARCSRKQPNNISGYSPNIPFFLHSNIPQAHCVTKGTEQVRGKMEMRPLQLCAKGTPGGAERDSCGGDDVERVFGAVGADGENGIGK